MMDATNSISAVSATVPIAKPQEYKCSRCYHIVIAADVCPVCGNTHLTELCPNDPGECTHDPVGGIAFCEICGEPVCPVCGAHDVVQLSRITGYVQDISAWNAGKRKELELRRRYTIS
jgi:hypothetical protein